VRDQPDHDDLSTKGLEMPMEKIHIEASRPLPNRERELTETKGIIGIGGTTHRDPKAGIGSSTCGRKDTADNLELCQVGIRTYGGRN
jgi:hypothetical protein